jgi:hypothetical protein
MSGRGLASASDFWNERDCLAEPDDLQEFHRVVHVRSVDHDIEVILYGDAPRQGRI